MAHGENAQKNGNNVGKDWWGKRPLSGLGVSRNHGMKYWKRRLHKIERNEGKAQIYKDQLASGVMEYALEKFKYDLNTLYHADLIVLPLTPEGEAEREYLMDYHHDDDGRLTHQSVHRYGAYEYNFEYEGEPYLAILVNND